MSTTIQHHWHLSITDRTVRKPYTVTVKEAAKSVALITKQVLHCAKDLKKRHRTDGCITFPSQ